MSKFIKKVSLFGFILALSYLGINVGITLSRQLNSSFSKEISMLSAQAAGTPDHKNESKSDRYETLELFQKVLHFVESNYVDEVKTKDLIQGAIKGMLETLDPHSNFLNAEVFKDMKIDTSGKFGGLGIEIGMKDNVLTIIAPIEDTPAWKAGLKSGDRIVKILGESTKGMSLMEAVSKMRGKKGTPVNLSIYREGWEKIRDVSIVRETIKIQSVKFEELEPGYGYARLASFNETAAGDIKNAIEKMEKKGKLKGLVFDLRGNPGGLLDQAVDVTSLFIDDGVVVSTIGRNRDQKDVKYAKKGMARKDLNLVVLVSQSSASASEIVAGALQDHNRALIMGQTTFGKGSVQTVIELGQDMGLKLTIARYYTPSGRSIQEKGVVPDVMLDDYDPKLLAEAKRKGESFREKDLKGHMVNPDGADEEIEKTDKAEKKEKSDFKKEELDSLGKKNGKKSADDEELAPVKFVPKEDYQVKAAVGQLKAFDVFKRIKGDPATGSK